MPRMRMFLDINVVEAARQRIRHVYDTFDTVCVQVSGGKDSTAALLLAKEVHEERDLGPVKVIFRDEEMVSPVLVDYLEWLREQPWVDMEWYCMPQGQEIWVLGQREYVLLWSKMREEEGRLVRPIPPYAITAEHFGLTRDEAPPESIDYYTMQGKVGQVAFVTGVRAAESMIRYRSCVQKLSENYIVRPYRLKKSVPLRFAKVIYDWSIDDCFKFISEEHDFPYCEYYDFAAITKSNTRVGIPLHAVPIRRIGDVVATEPEFYDRLVECFPQIDAQRRWWSSVDVDKYIDRYARDGWDGVRRCVDECMLTPGLRRRALSFVSEYRKKHVKDQYSYPIDALIRTLLLNEFHITSATPVGPKTRAHTLRMKAMQSLAEAEVEASNSKDNA